MGLSGRVLVRTRSRDLASVALANEQETDVPALANGVGQILGHEYIYEGNRNVSIAVRKQSRDRASVIL